MGKRDFAGHAAAHKKKSKRHKPQKTKISAQQLQQLQEEEEEQHELNESSFTDDLDDEMDAMIDVEQTIEIETETTSPPPPATPIMNRSASSRKQQSSGAVTPSSTSHSINTAAFSVSPGTSSTNTAITTKAKQKKRRESATSSDEERWLTAIESGKLEQVDDEMKKIKDPKLMTARQRAMYERNLDREPSPGREALLMSLPTGYREKEKPQTAEDIQKAVLKSQKRKQLADQKREKDKKKTMDRLLKKQDSGKQRGLNGRGRGAKTEQPLMSYRNAREGIFISLPAGHDFPLAAQVARTPPKVQMCGIAGCGQPKVYNCSKTNLPLCSFECYRKNVQAIRQIMC